MTAALKLEKEKYYLRFNENHDEHGRFASSDSSGGGSWGSSVDQKQADFNALKDNKKALYLYKSGYMSKEDSLAHMKDGTIGQYGDEYFSILRENGSYEPTGATRDNSNRAEQLVREGKAENWDDARMQLIKEDTGFSDAEAQETFDQMRTWLGGSWSKADTEVLDNYIDHSPAFDGVMHRGMHFDSDKELDAFMGNLQAGDRISMGKNASWTDDAFLHMLLMIHILLQLSLVCRTRHHHQLLIFHHKAKMKYCHQANHSGLSCALMYILCQMEIGKHRFL